MDSKDKKRLDIEDNNNEEENIYGDFMKVESENTPENTSENNDLGVEDNSDIKEDQPYVYKEKEYNKGYLEDHTKVTAASKASRGLLIGFYLLLLVLGVGAFLMIRTNKYEFYLKQDSVLIDQGSSYQVELIPKNERYFDYMNYNYSIADESIAKVDEFGTVTAVGKGETTLKISLSPGFSSKTMKIITEKIDVNDVEIGVYKGDNVEAKDTVDMTVNQSITVKPIVNSRNDLNVSGNYRSSDEYVATVDEFGNVTAKKPGTATIYSEVNDVEGQITVEVKDKAPIPTTKPTDPTTKPTSTTETKPTNTPKPTAAPTPKTTPKVITNIYISPSSVNLKKGSNAQLSVVITPSELSSSSLTWSTNNSKVATVKNGVVTAVAVGKATITAKTNNGKTASCVVNVTNDEVKATSITLNKTTLSLTIGGSYQLVATLKPENTSVRKLIWTSDNEKAAVVNQSGLVTAKAEGKATIMVTSSDGKAIAKCVVTVAKAVTPKPTVTAAPKSTASAKPTTTKPTSVSLGIASQTTKYVGDSLQLQAEVKPTTIKNYITKWSSSDTKIATVSSSGLVKFVSKGTVTITGEVNGVKGTATIIVKEKTTTPTASAPAGTAFKADQIKLSSTTLTVDKNKTKTFDISITKAAGTVKVTSSDTKVLKVTLPKGDDDMPICNQSTNICFLDGFSGSDKITITVTGVGAGTAYVNVNIEDIETTAGSALSGAGKVGVLVK